MVCVTSGYISDEITYVKAVITLKSLTFSLSAHLSIQSLCYRLVIMIRHHERDFPDFPCSGRECIPKLKEYRISEFLHYDDEENIGLVRLLTPVQFSGELRTANVITTGLLSHKGLVLVRRRKT